MKRLICINGQNVLFSRTGFPEGWCNFTKFHLDTPSRDIFSCKCLIYENCPWSNFQRSMSAIVFMLAQSFYLSSRINEILKVTVVLDPTTIKVSLLQPVFAVTGGAKVFVNQLGIIVIFPYLCLMWWESPQAHLSYGHRNHLWCSNLNRNFSYGFLVHASHWYSLSSIFSHVGPFVPGMIWLVFVVNIY